MNVVDISVIYLPDDENTFVEKCSFTERSPLLASNIHSICQYKLRKCMYKIKRAI